VGADSCGALALNRGDPQGGLRQQGHDLAGLAFVREHGLLALQPDHARGKGGRCAAFHLRLDGPVLFGTEGLDLGLAIHHQTHGHRLHPARRQTAPHLGPQHRADLVAHQPVEHAPRLLRLELVHVEFERMQDGVVHGLLCDLVEEHALNVRVGRPNLFSDMPGDGLALAVGVGRQQDLLCPLGRGLDVRDDLLLALDNHVFGLEVVFNVDAHAGLGQILDVPHRCLDHVARAQVLLDRCGLGGRLDDHQRATAALLGGWLGGGGLLGLRRLGLLRG